MKMDSIIGFKGRKKLTLKDKFCDRCHKSIESSEKWGLLSDVQLCGDDLLGEYTGFYITGLILCEDCFNTLKGLVTKFRNNKKEILSKNENLRGRS